MRLFANATAWHALLYWPSEDFGFDAEALARNAGDENYAKQLFLDQGCRSPEKLMRIILPLPG